MSLSILSADCRSRLYRIVWETIEGESVHAFILAGSRAEAKYLLHKAIVLLGREPDDEPSLFNLNSFEDLVNEGISEDEDLRVFETDWSREDGEMRPNWMTRPLFLLHDPTLLGKWTELQEDLAAQYTRDVIGRAGAGPMNSIVCHPFYQIAQGGAMVLPEVQQLTAAQLAFTGYLDKWAVTDKSGNPRCADTYREAP